MLPRNARADRCPSPKANAGIAARISGLTAIFRSSIMAFAPPPTARLTAASSTVKAAVRSSPPENNHALYRRVLR